MIDEEMKLTNQLCFSIYNANRLFNKFYQQSLAEFGLTYPQYLVLMTLWEQDGKTLHQLGDELGLSSNTLTPLLKRLEDKGWINRIRPDSDRRQLEVHLTKRGRDGQVQVFSTLSKCVSDQLDVNSYQTLVAENQQLVDALGEMVK